MVKVVVFVVVLVVVTGVPGAACAKARFAFVVTSIAGAVYAAYLPSLTSASRRALSSGKLDSTDSSRLSSFIDFRPQKRNRNYAVTSMH